MTHRPRTIRIIIIGFMILVGVCLAKSVYSQNALGVILAGISLAAGVYFVFLFNKANAEIEEAEWRERNR